MSPVHARDRAVSPVVGTVLLIGIVVVFGSIAAGFALGIDSPTTATQASISADIDADTNRIILIHDGGDTIDINDLSVRVEIENEPLAEQPPVPFFSTTGFRPGPTGPFNPAASQRWTVGERASFQIATTNDPALTPGDQVQVELFVEDRQLASVTTTA